MPEDEEIGAIFAAAKQLNDELNLAIEKKDLAAQRLLTVKISRLALDIKRIETRERLTLEMVMNGVREAKTPEERRENLLSAFRITAHIRSTAKYELVDDDLGGAAEAQLQALASGLDALEPNGRKALAPILDSFNFDERVCAAVALIPLMPDRALAVLRDLIKNAPGTNASLAARSALDGIKSSL